MNFPRPCWLAVLLVAGCQLAPPMARLPQTFTVTDSFGVAHPDQIIDFDLPPGTPTNGVVVINDAGQPVVFQFLEGGRKLAVRADLPAGATRRWTLQAAGPVGPANDAGRVVVTESEAHYEIVNDQTGVRVPKPAATLPAVEAVPAPIQGVRLADGRWTASGPNLLSVQATAVTGFTVRWIERGPLKTVIEVAYRFDRPRYAYGAEEIAPAGPGYYRSTITVQAGQPSILCAEDTDMDWSYSLDWYDAVEPTHARYRGHHARSKEAGYEPDGQVYRHGHNRPPLDAQVDLVYDRSRESNYVTTAESWRRMALWDPWVFDSGWYWQMFNAAAPETAPLLGIFAGRASRLLGAHMSGPGIFTRADPVRATGITVASYRRGPDARVFSRSRFEWGLFVSTKADLKPPTEVQPINRQMNLHGGFNLNKVHRWALDFPDPPGGYGGAFMPVAAVARVKERTRTDEAYFQWLYNADPYTRSLFDAWRDPSGTKRDAAVAQVTQAARAMLEALIHGGGIYDFGHHYWHGGLTAQRYGVWIDQLLAEPDLPAEQRRALKAAAVLFANVVWDDDHAPVSTTDHGLNLGTENMPLQQWGYRRFYALFLGRHPMMRARVPPVVAGLRAAVEQQINDHGAHIGCPHYIGASFAPTLNTLLQVKQLGPLDPFAAWPKLAKFAEFYLNLLTPPEPRVGGHRCFIALGDSGTEPSEIYGALATGCRDADPRLSARLMGAWQAGGKPHSFFFGSTVLMIDDALPARDPALTDATFPGYYTVLRHGWGTADETALWVVNGDHYRDHRHSDHGAVVLYALGQPLMVDWSAIYTPHTPGAYLHSTIVPETAIGHPWDQNGAALSGPAVWQRSSQSQFVSTPGRAGVTSQFERDDLQWERRTIVDRAEPARPVVLIRDTFSGAAAAAPKVASFFLMAAGPIETPHGPVTPPLHTHPNANSRPDAPATELPSATPPLELAAGLHRFGFTGQHGVDCEVYLWAEQPVQVVLGNWAVTAWGGSVTQREERQHILRIRGSGPFTTIILPRRSGAPPTPVTVGEQDGKLEIAIGGRAVAF